MQPYGITCTVYDNLVAIIAEKVINVLPMLGEQFGISLKNLEKEVSDPLGIIDLIKSPSKEVVGDPLRSSIKIQVGRKMTIYEVVKMALEIPRANARRQQAISENTSNFFFAFELSFNRYIQKAKEFFPNINPHFLTLIDLNVQSLIDEVLRGDIYTFINIANVALGVGLEMATFSPLVEMILPQNVQRL